MSMAKRWLETLPEFDEVEEPEFVLSDADIADWVRSIDALIGYDVAEFEDNDETGIYDDEPAIKDDYDWIRRGC